MYKLETRALSKVFARGDRMIEALRDINIGIEAGAFVSIVGASGCGKTTFLRTVDGLIEPSSGEILIDGKPVAGPSSDRAFVFQRDSLFPWRSVLQNAVFGPEVRGDEMKAARSLAQRFLALVGLEGFEKYYPHEISGGMRQRVNLARALTMNPEVLLMDEPFAALDAQTREIMQTELLRIWREAKKTVLFVTHQIDEAVFLSDRVLVFTVRPGRLKESIAIDLPRPRMLELKRTSEFVRYVDRIWRLIEEEVRAGARPELPA
ncbi:MAG: ABC transporter ATP-binding protein [Stellaceae bacterium]